LLCCKVQIRAARANPTMLGHIGHNARPWLTPTALTLSSHVHVHFYCTFLCLPLMYYPLLSRSCPVARPLCRNVYQKIPLVNFSPPTFGAMVQCVLERTSRSRRCQNLSAVYDYVITVHFPPALRRRPAEQRIPDAMHHAAAQLEPERATATQR
jgi:hypothetical protein